VIVIDALARVITVATVMKIPVMMGREIVIVIATVTVIVIVLAMAIVMKIEIVSVMVMLTPIN
jgi:hypothetical protein